MHLSCVSVAGDIAKELTHASATVVQANVVTFAALVVLVPRGIERVG